VKRPWADGRRLGGVGSTSKKKKESETKPSELESQDKRGVSKGGADLSPGVHSNLRYEKEGGQGRRRKKKRNMFKTKRAKQGFAIKKTKKTSDHKYSRLKSKSSRKKSNGIVE